MEYKATLVINIEDKTGEERISLNYDDKFIEYRCLADALDYLERDSICFLWKKDELKENPDKEETDDDSIMFPEDIPIIRDFMYKQHIKFDYSNQEIADLWTEFSSSIEAIWLDPTEFWLNEFCGFFSFQSHMRNLI